MTYPYIMAKVRIQARSADVDDAIAHHSSKPQPHHFHHDKTRHIGALDILARVWRKEGPLGWYQVRLHFSVCRRIEADKHLYRAWVPKSRKLFSRKLCSSCQRSSSSSGLWQSSCCYTDYAIERKQRDEYMCNGFDYLCAVPSQ